MKNSLTSSRWLAAWLLAGCCAGVAAQSLGTPRAQLWIGQPLALSIPARLADSGCLQATVSYGDRQLRPERVRVELAGLPDDQKLRVEADAPIDEAVVNLTLRAGCRETITRSYTLLPEQATPSALAHAATATAGGPPAAKVRKTAPRAKQEVQPRAGSAGQPRLRLEPWEPEPATLLRVTAQLAPSGAIEPQAPAANAALQKLESEMALLRGAAMQSGVEVTALLRLDGDAGWLPVQAAKFLTVLLLAAAGMAAFLWHRSEQAAAWGGRGTRRPKSGH